MMMMRLGMVLALLLPATAAAQPSAAELIRKMESQMIGKSFAGRGTMTIRKPGDERSLTFMAWTKDRKFALIKIEEPKREAGTGNLRVDFDLWQYLPRVNRVIKIPSSMMIQSWMGSDFTNDDLVKGTNLSRDYTHRLLGVKKIGDEETYEIESTPKPEAPVVWGKLISNLRKSDQTLVLQKFFTERGKLVKTLEGRKIRRFGSHAIPTHITMRRHSKDSVTTVEYEPESVKFDFAVSDDFFTQRNLQKANPRP